MRRKTHPFGRSWRAEAGQRKHAKPKVSYAEFRLGQINDLRERRGLEPMTDAATAIEWERRLRLGA